MRRLVCPVGHEWDQPDSAAVPADLTLACPFCQPSQTMAHQSPDADVSPTLHAPPPARSSGVTPPPPTPPSPMPSSVPGFEVLAELSRGGMGVVYKARQLGLNRTVALKVIAPERVSHPDALNRFRREVQAAARLSHPHIVTVFHTDLSGPLCYLAMEFVNGIDLQRLVATRGPCAPAEAVTYTRQACLALQHAHEQGLVHRDIKPGNLMVAPSPVGRPAGSPPGFVKVLDMGLARLTHEVDELGAQPELTQVGEFLGTPDYISPEQSDDPRAADIRSDIYSLGGTLYYLLTGQVPFPGGSLMQKLRRHLTAPPPAASAVRPDVPAAVDAVIARAMAKEPSDRFQTPDEMAAALDRSLAGAAPAPAAPKPAAPAAPGGAATPPGTTAARLAGHRGAVHGLSVSADGRFLLSGGQDETLRLWSLATFKELRCFPESAGLVTGVHMSADSRWAASCSMRVFVSDMVVQVWETAGGREKGRLRGHKQNVTCVRFAPDGRTLASGSADATIRLWPLTSRESPLVLSGHEGQVNCLFYMASGRTLLSGGADGTVRLWDGTTGAAKGRLRGRVGPVRGVAYSDATSRIAFCGDGVRVRHGDGSFVEFSGHKGPVLAVAFAPDGRRLLSAGADGLVKLWDPEGGGAMEEFDGGGGKAFAVEFAPDGQTAFVACEDGSIRRWPVPG